MWLRVKLTAVIVGCIVLPLSLTLGAVWLGGEQTLSDQAARGLKGTTQSLVTAIEGRLALDLLHLKAFAALPVMQDVLIADSGGEIARILAELKERYREFAELQVADARGAVIAAAPADGKTSSAADDDGFRAAASGSIYQSALRIREAPATAATISFSVPLTAAYDRQTVIGTLSGVVDVGQIAGIVKAQSILAANDNAVIVVRRQDGRIGFATHSDGTIAAIATRGADSLNWRGAPYFAAGASSTGKDLVRDPGFAVHAVAPATAAFGAAGQLSTIAGAVAVIAAAAALVFAWRWSTPLVMVAAAMGRLARGSGAERAPEVALSHTFGPMTRAFESLRQAKAVQEFLAGRERELVRKKEEAEQALREKSEHLASLTRALKDQLATIVELSEAINAEALNAVMGNTRASLAKDISRSGAQLLAVINDLFELSEAEAGHMTLKETETDLGALVRDCVEMMHDASHKANVIVACIPPETCLTALVDTQKIKQIMFNLLSNAIKFTPEGGRIEVTLKTDADGRAAIVVADTGIGMPANLSPMAFSAAADANTPGRHGAGLGLPLVRQFVDMHDGTFEVESEPGKGTVAKVTLPKQRLVAPRPEHEALKLIA